MPRRNPVLALLFVLAAFLIVLGLTVDARSAPFARAPRVVSCDQQHPLECSRAIAYWRREAKQARRAVSWQRRARATEVRHVLAGVRGAQPFAYAAKLAYAACLSFENDTKRCRKPSEMLTVGRCESGLKLHNPNPSSTADNWMQYLLSTWLGTAVAKTGYFSRYDPLAVAIAAESSARSGWSGPWAASKHCHGLT